MPDLMQGRFLPTMRSLPAIYSRPLLRNSPTKGSTSMSRWRTASPSIWPEVRMKGEFRTLRMYTREAPKIEMEHVFGITSFELG